MSHLHPEGSENMALCGARPDKHQLCYSPASATLTVAYSWEKMKPSGASGFTPPLRNLHKWVSQHWSHSLYLYATKPNGVLTTEALQTQ